jgi:hypothetical protein
VALADLLAAMDQIHCLGHFLLMQIVIFALPVALQTQLQEHLLELQVLVHGALLVLALLLRPRLALLVSMVAVAPEAEVVEAVERLEVLEERAVRLVGLLQPPWQLAVVALEVQTDLPAQMQPLSILEQDLVMVVAAVEAVVLEEQEFAEAAEVAEVAEMRLVERAVLELSS